MPGIQRWETISPASACVRLSTVHGRMLYSVKLSNTRLVAVLVVQSLSHVRHFATHGLQHTRLPCPSPSPRACSNPCPLSRWCHPTISSSVAHFCPKSFPASGSFIMSQFFISGGQIIWASASVLPINIQGWFTLALTGLSSLQSKGLSRVFSSTTVLKRQFLGTQLSLWFNSHFHMWLLHKP